MPIILKDIDPRVRSAVRHYWKTLGTQASRQGAESGRSDTGNRNAVTGGKQMDGFTDLLMGVLADNGITKPLIHRHAQLEIPGYFRPTKKWDMLIFHERVLLAVIEFKSQRGPSFGNNWNNRAEEAIGTATDTLVAYRERAFGDQAPKPWLGWLMLLEDCNASQRPLGVSEPHFTVFPEFKDSSYSKRYEILLRKLRLENLFNETALILAKESEAARGGYSEPAQDLSTHRFLASFAGHIAGIIAS
ncbi:MAG: hypothetical protein QOC81_886 [Thermoanaerobaculia bacterium]|jgi:hypothetical protein|nr:hypothetical protein [Thermoanaerobaculia bacterium]